MNLPEDPLKNWILLSRSFSYFSISLSSQKKIALTIFEINPWAPRSLCIKYCVSSCDYIYFPKASFGEKLKFIPSFWRRGKYFGRPVPPADRLIRHFNWFSRLSFFVSCFYFIYTFKCIFFFAISIFIGLLLLVESPTIACNTLRTLHIFINLFKCWQFSIRRRAKGVASGKYGGGYCNALGGPKRRNNKFVAAKLSCVHSAQITLQSNRNQKNIYILRWDEGMRGWEVGGWGKLWQQKSCNKKTVTDFLPHATNHGGKKAKVVIKNADGSRHVQLGIMDTEKNVFKFNVGRTYLLSLEKYSNLTFRNIVY